MNFEMSQENSHRTASCVHSKQMYSFRRFGKVKALVTKLVLRSGNREILNAVQERVEPYSIPKLCSMGNISGYVQVSQR